MEEKYQEELRKLGFTAGVDSIKTVLETRAYHNMIDKLTDSSYAVLNVPACLDAKTEIKIRDLLFSSLIECHASSVEMTHYSPAGMSPTRIDGDQLQLEFSGALTEKEIVEKFTALLEMLQQIIREIFLEESSTEDADDPNVKKRKRGLALVYKRIKAIRILIMAGSVSYAYHVDSYSVFD